MNKIKNIGKEVKICEVKNDAKLKDKLMRKGLIRKEDIIQIRGETRYLLWKDKYGNIRETEIIMDGSIPNEKIISKSGYTYRMTNEPFKYSNNHGCAINHYTEIQRTEHGLHNTYEGFNDDRTIDYSCDFARFIIEKMHEYKTYKQINSKRDIVELLTDILKKNPNDILVQEMMQKVQKLQNPSIVLKNLILMKAGITGKGRINQKNVRYWANDREKLLQQMIKDINKRIKKAEKKSHKTIMEIKGINELKWQKKKLQKEIKDLRKNYLKHKKSNT